MANNTQMMKLSGWQPHISLDEGLRDIIEWVREDLGRFRVGTFTLWRRQ